MERFCSFMLHKNTGEEGTTFWRPGTIEKSTISLVEKDNQGYLQNAERIRATRDDLPDWTKHSLTALQPPSKPGLLNLPT